MSGVVREQEWEAAVATLHAADEVALICHLGPDGDALGSLLGLTQALRQLGKRTVASWGSSPFEVPSSYAGLPGLDLLTPPEQFPGEPDLLVTLDTGSQDRLGSLATVVDRARVVLVIDHHASNTRYGTLHLVDPTAAATAVLVEELVRRLGVSLTADIAAPLYTGVITDTGSFKFAATTPATHELAARLLATGIRHDLISRAVWDTNAFGYVQLLGVLLTRAALEPEAAAGLGMVWTHSTADDLRRHGVVLDEVEGVIDVIRTAREAEVAVIAKEGLDGQLRVSTRSKGRVDVGEICTALGGGGHRFAAGYTSDAAVGPTLAVLRECLESAPHLPG